MKLAFLNFILFFWTSIGFTQDSLYYMCANELIINSTNYKIKSLEGADSIIIENKIFLIPYEYQVKLKVLEKGVEKNKVFLVINSPYPSIEVSLLNKNITCTKEVSSINSEFKIRAVPEINFAINHPRECRYRVSDFKIEVFRNGVLIKFEERKPNDILIISVNKIERYNFKNQKEIIDIQEKYTYTLN